LSTTTSHQLQYETLVGTEAVAVRKLFTLASSILIVHPSAAYPAQHGKTPGVITISPQMFYFTPLLSGPRLDIPAEDLLSIKKATPRGISIGVRDASQEDGERKMKFLMVYERDEMFGRLVGMRGMKWTRI
jgi:hypothetical protein